MDFIKAEYFGKDHGARSGPMSPAVAQNQHQSAPLRAVWVTAPQYHPNAAPLNYCSEYCVFNQLKIKNIGRKKGFRI